jgi:SAM-dependent methyltransferase
VEPAATLEQIDCPLCGADDHVLWAWEGGYAAVKCKQCSLVYVNPRPSLSTISEATKTGVHKTDSRDLSVTFRRSPRKFYRYRSIVRRMFAAEIAAGKPLNWLDIGAGYGEFVEAVLAAMPRGETVCGVEPMKPKVEAARARGLPIVDTPLSQIEGQYDVISLINVFSHIPNFEDFLRQAVAHSSPGGVVFLETGNGGDVERSQYPDELFLPDHLVFAGIEHIDLLLQKVGFRMEMVCQRRVDTARGVVKRAIKGLLKGRLELSLPYVSPFRTVFFKARRVKG